MSMTDSKAGEASILIVDDQKFLRLTVGSLLTNRGYGVSAAETGEEAILFLRASLPDLVLLDVNMPGMTGMEVCRRIKANPRTREVRVIMLTADAEKETVLECFEAGADDYQLKPYAPEKLIEKIEGVLAKREPKATPVTAEPADSAPSDVPPSSQEDEPEPLPAGTKLKKAVPSVLRLSRRGRLS